MLFVELARIVSLWNLQKLIITFFKAYILITLEKIQQMTGYKELANSLYLWFFYGL